MIKNGYYDSSLDEDNDQLWDKKYIEWQSRDWRNWLLERLPFQTGGGCAKGSDGISRLRHVAASGRCQS